MANIEYPMKKKKSKLANKTVKLKDDVTHPQFPSFGGSEIVIEDWWVNVYGGSWMNANGNPAAMIYGMRSGFNGLPTDNEVLYGKLGGYGVLIHVSEIEGA